MPSTPRGRSGRQLLCKLDRSHNNQHGRTQNQNPVAVESYGPGPNGNKAAYTTEIRQGLKRHGQQSQKKYGSKNKGH